jgi:hypothetical protein
MQNDACAAEAPRPCRTGVHVYVIVLDGAVLVRAGGNIQAAPKRPEADRDQRDADDALAPGGQDVDGRQQLAEDDREQCDDDDA